MTRCRCNYNGCEQHDYKQPCLNEAIPDLLVVPMSGQPIPDWCLPCARIRLAYEGPRGRSLIYKGMTLQWVGDWSEVDTTANRKDSA